jgi:peptidoglycan DL-endopeptidase CwlO
MNITHTKSEYKNKKFYTPIKVKNMGAKLVIMLALFLLPNLSWAATVDEINQQIQNTTNALNQTKNQKASLANEVAGFDSQIGAVQNQIYATSNDIAKTEAEINSTKTKITDAQTKITVARSNLADIIQTSYEDSQQSSIEVIAKSRNFSEYVNRSTYLESVQVKVTESANQIIALKRTLEDKQKTLEADKKKTQELMQAQALQRQALATQRSSKDYLLQVTAGNEATYQKNLGTLYAQRAALSVRNNEGISGGGSAYPYSGASGNGVDPWGFYNRQCTSYAAWHSATSGPVSGAILSDWGHGHTANGGDWGNLGRSHGLNVSSSPSAGAIMSFPYSGYLPYGHVAIVESVNGDGTVNISEYNWSTPLGFGRRSNVNPYNYGAVFIR